MLGIHGVTAVPERRVGRTVLQKTRDRHLRHGVLARVSSGHDASVRLDEDIRHPVIGQRKIDPDNAVVSKRGDEPLLLEVDGRERGFRVPPVPHLHRDDGHAELAEKLAQFRVEWVEKEGVSSITGCSPKKRPISRFTQTTVSDGANSQLFSASRPTTSCPLRSSPIGCFQLRIEGSSPLLRRLSTT